MPGDLKQRTDLIGTIERLRAEIQAAEDKVAGLEQRRQEREAVAQANYETAVAKLEKDMGVANDYADRQPVDTSHWRPRWTPPSRCAST